MHDPLRSSASREGTACPDENELAGFLDGALLSHQRLRFQAHLDECARCRSTIAAIFVCDAVDGGPTRGATSTQGLTTSGNESAVDRAILGRGMRIGRFIVLDLIGMGGMGLVYSAYDPHLDRKVALKLVRDGHGLRREERRLRLQREARALARLSDPNVINVYEVGIAGEQIFIAMELVEGWTLSEWLSIQRRSWHEIVQLFVHIGRGIAAAHRAGVVHRDIKPENIQIGKDGRVRVTDFGLARTAARGNSMAAMASSIDSIEAVSPQLGQSGLTLSGTRIGTPAYMAPEQRLGLPAGTRSDQFSFCVVLYESIFGNRPMIPGWSDQTDLPGANAKARVPSHLRRQLWRGLSLDPADRFPSMEPLLAGLTQSLKHRRRWFALVAIITASLAATAGGYRMVDARARRCGGSEAHLQGVWDAKRKQVVRDAFVKANALSAESSFERVEKLLDSYAVDWARSYQDACQAAWVGGKQSSQLLDARMSCLRGRLRELDSLVSLFQQADAKTVVRASEAARSLRDLGDCANEATLRLRTGPPPESIQSRVDALREKLIEAGALSRLGKYVEGIAVVEQVMGEIRSLGYRPLLAEGLVALGSLEGLAGRAGPAEEALWAGAVEAEAANDDGSRLKALIALVQITGRQPMRQPDARRFAEMARGVLARIGGSPLQEAFLLDAIGTLNATARDYDGALSVYQSALAIREQRLATSSPLLSLTRLNVAHAFEWKGDFSSAIQQYRVALPVLEKNGDELHIPMTYSNLGVAQLAMGRVAEAIALQRQAIALWEQRLGPHSTYVALGLNRLGRALSEAGQLEEAFATHRRALEIRVQAQGNEHLELAPIHEYLGVLLGRQREYARARDSLSRALSMYQKAGSEGKRQVGRVWAELGDLLLSQRRYREALSHFETAVELLRESAGDQHPLLARPLRGIGTAWLALNRRDQALTPLRRALALQVEHQSPPMELARTKIALANALWAPAQDHSGAIDLIRQASNDLEKSEPSWTRSETRAQLDVWLKAHRLQ